MENRVRGAPVRAPVIALVQRRRGLAGVADDLADGVEQQKAQPFGSGGTKLLGLADALAGRTQLVEDHIEAQPGGIGAEFLTGQDGAGELVHQHVMGVLDGPGFSAVPADQVETTAVVGSGKLVTIQKWRTRLPSRSSSPWRGRTRMAR
jgi:hypothetical protein